MKSVCSVHEQAYDVGEHCPYCDVPSWAKVSPYPLRPEALGLLTILPEPITFTAPPEGWELKLVPGALPGKMIWDIWSRLGKS